ncbi:MAG: putative F420-dependent oxidoreductase [Paraglaciecola psychrophila]|jgi:probable F420-dependent oxidoreductase
MKITTSLPVADLQTVGGTAKELEAAGFDGVSTQESAHDPFMPLAVAATTTATLELKTSVAIAFARSPMVAANLGWDLQAASHGRFTLGLGSQVKGHNVRRFSVPWSAPAPRLREYVQAIRAIWRCWQHGERLDYQGEHYQFSLMTPNFSPQALSCALPPIHISAVGPAMMKLAGEECDGVMLHPFCSKLYLQQSVIPRLEKALADSGRKRENFEISGGGFVATGVDDEAVANMFEWVRMRIGFYGSTPAYWPVLETHGLEDLGHKLNALSKQGEWDAMTAQIPDDLVYKFAAVGRFDEIANKIDQRYGGISDAIAGTTDMPKGLLQDIARIATPYVGAIG